MPYSTPYNKRIADEVGQYNHRFATLFAYSPVDGRSGYAEGGSAGGVLFQMGNASKRDGEDNIYNDDITLPSVYYEGQDSEGMKGGSGFAEGTFRDTGIGHQDGASAVYQKGSGQEVGGNLWTDIYHGFEDLGSDIGKATDYVFGSGHPEHHAKKARLLGRMMGKMMKEMKEGKGMSGGSWWDSLKEGVSDVVGLVPHLLLHGLGQEVPASVGAGKKRGRKAKKSGGAILGNPDPYPVQGDSQRLAGRGKKELVSKAQDDLLAMPEPVLANGVPPKAQLRGSYGGAKPQSKAEKKVMDAVAKKLKGGKNLSGMTDQREVMGAGKVDGRKARAEVVKKIMKEKGMKMIEASKYVKEHGLYKK